MQHIPDIVSVLMNFHPRFGLADETRIKTLRDAEIHGVAEAARMNNTSKESIYRWRRRLNPER
jgi:hypothetical protein